MNRFFLAGCTIVFASLNVASALAADQTWSGGGAGTGNAWLTAGNWVGNAVPGVTSAVTGPTNTDLGTIVATGNNATIGIGGTAFYVGAIDLNSASNRTIGASGTTGATLNLQLNGKTVNSVPNVILRNENSGTLTLQPTNTGSGATNILQIVLGNATDNVINIDGSGGITIGVAVTGSGKHVTLGGGGAGILIISGANTYDGGTTVNSGKTLQIGNGAGGSLSDTGILNNNGSVVFNRTGNYSYQGEIDGAGSVTKTGTGILTLNNASTSYSGGTTVSQGALVWNNNNALGTNTVTINDANTGANNTSLYKNNSGTLARNITVANAGSGTVMIGNDAGTNTTATTYSGTVTLNRDATFKSGAGALVVFSGAIGGNGAVNVTGTGNVELDNSNSYGGGTTLTTGTLLANNASGSATGTGAVTVAAGTLGGNGAISGAVTLNGGALSPGVAAGNIAALNTGALTFNSGSTFAYELNSSPTPSADLVNAAGALNIALSGAALSIADLGNSVLPANTKFTLISYSGTWNGNTFDTYADDSTITVGSNQFVLNYNDTSVGSGNLNGSSFTNAVTLTLTAVPEAGAFAFGALACVMVGGIAIVKSLIGKRRTNLAQPCTK